MKKVKLFEQFINEANNIFDKRSNEFLFEQGKKYSPSEFLKIIKKSTEGKEAINSRNSNLGKGIQAVEYLNKNLPIPIEISVYRSEWNYGGNLVVLITFKGDPGYPYGDWFKFNSGNSTTQPGYYFGGQWSGAQSADGTSFATGSLYGTYKSITNFNEVLTDIIYIFNEFERINGEPFNPKTANKIAKDSAKIKTDWEKLKPSLEKLYNETRDLAKKISYDIKLSFPEVRIIKKKVYYKTDEPRELRHPDEYGERAEKMMSTKEYYQYEKNQAKISDILEKFAKKYGFEFVWAANW